MVILVKQLCQYAWGTVEQGTQTYMPWQTYSRYRNMREYEVSDAKWEAKNERTRNVLSLQIKKMVLKDVTRKTLPLLLLREEQYNNKVVG